MGLVAYKLHILGLKRRQGTLPLSALKSLSTALLESSERVLRLFVEGRSTKRGKSPVWLKRALDFTITGMRAGSTILELDVPALKDSIPDQFAQKMLLGDVVKPEDTPLTLVSKSVTDAAAGHRESDFFDAGVLDSLLSFGPVMKQYGVELDITSETKAKDNFRINRQSIQTIGQIKIETPESRMVALSGFFNLIEHAARRFQLKMGNGQSVEGTIDPSHVGPEQMRKLWGKKATIKGTAHFRPSGKIRSIEAIMIRAVEGGDEVLSELPENQGTFQVASLTEDYLRKRSVNRVLKEIWGKWPGDEPIDDLLTALNGNAHQD